MRSDGFTLQPADEAALAALPDGWRALLEAAVDQVAYDNIASANRLPIGTVKSRVHRAKGKIEAARKAVQNVGNAENPVHNP